MFKVSEIFDHSFNNSGKISRKFIIVALSNNTISNYSING